MREGDHLVLGREHRLRRVQIDPAVFGQRADIDLPARQLPRHDIGVMLQLAEQHAALIGVAIGDKVDRFGRTAGKDEFILTAANKGGDPATRSLVTQRHLRRAAVDPAMDGRIILAQRARHRIDYHARFLRGGTAVEIVPRLAIPGQQAGELRPDAKIRAVHGVAFAHARSSSLSSAFSSSASRVASSASSRVASPMKACTSRRRMVSGGRPRAAM